MVAEFCPKCDMSLDISGDNTRLCETCGWFGDSTETSMIPPDAKNFNPVRAILEGLASYRDVCRNELIMEQVYDAGDMTEDDLRKVKLEINNALYALIDLFTAIRGPHEPPLEETIYD